jgi:hypothetical protein
LRYDGLTERCAVSIGKPINRHQFFVLKDGTPVLEWDDDLLQDLLSGDFIQGSKKDYSHAIRDDELGMLVRAGRVEQFDERQVFIFSLPEPPRRTME